MIRRWWTKKYRLPHTAEAFQKYTLEELWVEFYEDYYEAHPSEAIASEGDDVQFITGDPEFDALEQRIQDGASDEEILEVLASWEGKKPSDVKRSLDKAEAEGDTEEVFRQLEEIGEGFADDYTVR